MSSYSQIFMRTFFFLKERNSNYLQNAVPPFVFPEWVRKAGINRNPENTSVPCWESIKFDRSFNRRPCETYHFAGSKAITNAD